MHCLKALLITTIAATTTTHAFSFRSFFDSSSERDSNASDSASQESTTTTTEVPMLSSMEEIAASEDFLEANITAIEPVSPSEKFSDDIPMESSLASEDLRAASVDSIDYAGLETYDAQDIVSSGNISTTEVPAKLLFSNIGSDFAIVSNFTRKNEMVSEMLTNSSYESIKVLFEARNNYSCVSDPMLMRKDVASTEEDDNESTDDSVSAKQEEESHGPCEFWIGDEKLWHGDDCSTMDVDNMFELTVAHCESMEPTTLPCNLSMYRMTAAESGSNVNLHFQCIPNISAHEAIEFASEDDVMNESMMSVSHRNSTEHLRKC